MQGHGRCAVESKILVPVRWGCPTGMLAGCVLDAGLLLGVAGILLQKLDGWTAGQVTGRAGDMVDVPIAGRRSLAADTSDMVACPGWATVAQVRDTLAGRLAWDGWMGGWLLALRVLPLVCIAPARDEALSVPTSHSLRMSASYQKSRQTPQFNATQICGRCSCLDNTDVMMRRCSEAVGS